MAMVVVWLLAATTATPGDFEAGHETVWLQDKNVLSCAPPEVRRGEKVTLTLGPGHGKELAVLRESDGTWHFLVVQMPIQPKNMLMSREAFEQASLVEIPTSVLSDEDQLVFTVAGLYTIFTSEVLESERGGYKCTITFRP